MEIDEFVEQLVRDATERKRRNVLLIHEICRDEYKHGSKDFSIATIGRISGNRGGPKSQSIRNKNGKIYCSLIKAWSLKVNGNCHKVHRTNEEADKAITTQIGDPVLRAIFELKNKEIKTLKGKLHTAQKLLNRDKPVIIDLRNNSSMHKQNTLLSLIDKPSTIDLNEAEIDALKHALSEELLREMDWESDEIGRVKTRNGYVIFKPGFITAIRKILDKKRP